MGCDADARRGQQPEHEQGGVGGAGGAGAAVCLSVSVFVAHVIHTGPCVAPAGDPGTRAWCLVAVYCCLPPLSTSPSEPQNPEDCMGILYRTESGPAPPHTICPDARRPRLWVGWWPSCPACRRTRTLQQPAAASTSPPALLMVLPVLLRGQPPCRGRAASSHGCCAWAHSQVAIPVSSLSLNTMRHWPAHSCPPTRCCLWAMTWRAWGL